MKKWSFKKIFKTVWFSFAILFFIWNWYTFQSHNLPVNTFENSAQVTVKITDDQISFQPVTGANPLEFIFFQGGMTDPKAYGPICRKLAENGFTCHLIKMDWRLPKYDYQKTLKLFDLKKGSYVIAGHSQGGVMAAQLVFENPGMLKGLCLLGTSHPRDIDMSNIEIPCIKLYAEHDGLASVEEVMANKPKLPAGTRLVEIKGGNHSQFGYLGKLLMDDSAEITLEEQQEIIIKELIGFLKKIENTKL